MSSPLDGRAAIVKEGLLTWPRKGLSFDISWPRREGLSAIYRMSLECDNSIRSSLPILRRALRSAGTVRETIQQATWAMAKPLLRKWLLVSVGILSVGLAAAGVFLPLLPTTPFLLLAAACFIRSSDRLYWWLTGHKWFGPYIRGYREHKAITTRARVVALLLLWATLGYAAIAVVNALAVRVLLSVVGVGVTLHLVRLKTLTPEMLSLERSTGGIERRRGQAEVSSDRESAASAGCAGRGD